MPAETEGVGLYTEAQKARVLDQLERVLGNPHFSHSKRFPSFLRFVVREELEGRGDLLKERTLGIEVFGRRASYDTTADPIVRVTAAEIRKRIAQYYQEAGQPRELRISLPPGSYVPHFDWGTPGVDAPSTGGSFPLLGLHAQESSLPEPVILREDTAPSPAAERGDRSRAAEGRKHRRTLLCTAALLLLLAAGIGLWIRSRPSTLNRFWAPVFASGDSITVCFPETHFNGIILRDAADPTHEHQMPEKLSEVLVDDLQPLVSLSGMLERAGQHYTLLGEDMASLTDLRHGPTIFLGAFDNAWTLRVTRSLRFRFANDADMSHFWIEDTASQTGQHWGIDRSVQEATHTFRDYAIVARFVDPNTGKLAVVAAGIAQGGTIAAGEFLTERETIESVEAHAPKGWRGKNMEFVLSTEIIDGHSSPPKVEATHFW